MSIATLKRKTYAKYNNMSVGSKNGFSLNGTHRSQGYIGQTMLSRSLPRTPMKGNTPKGYGGCCGKYRITPIIQSGVTSTENPFIIKSSVLGTHGMLATKYRWIRRPQPYTSVKPDTNKNINDQQSYIERLRKKVVRKADECHIKSKVCVPKFANFNSYYKTFFYNYTKPETDYVAMSAGQYIDKVNKRCTDYDDINVPTKINKTPMLCS